MSQEENILLTPDGEGLEGQSIQHHRHHHRHRIRVKQKVKTKKISSRVKKKVKKYVMIIIWTVLILLFIGSIYVLFEELSKSPGTILKDRRNRSEILIKDKQDNTNNILLS